MNTESGGLLKTDKFTMQVSCSLGLNSLIICINSCPTVVRFSYQNYRAAGAVSSRKAVAISAFASLTISL